MNFNAMLQAVGDSLRNTRSAYHLTLGELIDYLEIKVAGLENDLPVVFSDDFMLHPCEANSYRGYFTDVAIGTQPGGWTKSCSVSSLLTLLSEVIDQDLTGYKGGEFTMGRDTPLWRSNYGKVSSDAIVGVTMHGGNKVVLQIKHINYP